MTAPRYRICANQAPHHEDWWTVEESYPVRRLFQKPYTAWRALQVFDRVDTRGFQTKDLAFPTEAEAQAWVDEAKRPRVDACGEAQ